MKFLSLIIFSLFLFSCVYYFRVKPSDDRFTRIKVAVFPNLDKAYGELIDEFEKENPDIKVELQVLGFGEHHNMIISKLASNNKLQDVIAVESKFIDALYTAFQNLSEHPYNADELKKDFFPYKLAQASSGNDTLWAMPVDIAPACVWYRVDVFESRGVNIDDIEDLEDLYNAGKILTFDGNLDGKVDHWLLPNADLIFEMIFLSSKERYYEDGEINFKSPIVVKAISWAKKFREAGYDAKVKEWTIEWYRGLDKGKFAYTISGAWLGWHLENWITPGSYGKFRVAELPKLNKTDIERMNFNKGGSFLAIPKKAPYRNKEAAWRLIKWLVARKESQIFAYEKADLLPAYLPAWDEKIFDEGIEYIGGQKVKRLWKNMALNIPEVYVTSYDFYAKHFLDEALYEVLEKGYEIDLALERAQASFYKKINE